MTNSNSLLRFGNIILIGSILILVFMMVSSGKAYVDHSHYVKYVNDDWRHTVSVGDSVTNSELLPNGGVIVSEIDDTIFKVETEISFDDTALVNVRYMSIKNMWPSHAIRDSVFMSRKNILTPLSYLK